VLSQPRYRCVEVVIGDSECVVDVETAAPVRDPELGTRQADPCLRARHQPDAAAVFPAIDDWEAKNSGVERLGCVEVYDLQHKLAKPLTGMPAILNLPNQPRLSAIRTAAAQVTLLNTGPAESPIITRA
jgi:hypothetical protein